MAHFAELDENNIVKQVIVVHNNELLVDGVEVESKGIQFCQNLFGGNWIQTSYNHNIRKQYAFIGCKYDGVRDEFVLPQPYPSWTLDVDNDWQPPTPKPESGLYEWNELTQSWDELDFIS
jgi:hypothetical protein